MNVDNGAEAALFPEKEYVKGIFVAVYEVSLIEVTTPPRLERGIKAYHPRNSYQYLLSLCAY
jgi:hypothetical protein